METLHYIGLINVRVEPTPAIFAWIASVVLLRILAVPFDVRLRF